MPIRQFIPSPIILVIVEIVSFYFLVFCAIVTILKICISLNATYYYSDKKIGETCASTVNFVERVL